MLQVHLRSSAPAGQLTKENDLYLTFEITMTESSKFIFYAVITSIVLFDGSLHYEMCTMLISSQCIFLHELAVHASEQVWSELKGSSRN